MRNNFGTVYAGEVPESVVKMQCWGSVGSNSIAHYAHLSSKDVDAILLNHAGLKVAQKPSDTQVKPRQCSQCGEVNAPTARYCSICGQPLTEEAQQVVQDTEEQIRQLFIQNPQAQMAFLQILNSLKKQPA